MLAQYLRQAGEIRGFMVNIFMRNIGSAAVPSDDQSPFNEQVDGFSNGHPRDTELFRQLFLTRQRAANIEIWWVEP